MSEIPPLTIDPDAPPDPVYVLELAEALAEIARALNRQTLHHEALHYPSEAAGLLQHLDVAVSRLPQLLGQVSGWIGTEHENGRIRVSSGPRAGWSSLATATARGALDEAAAAARTLEGALKTAAREVARMRPAGDDGSGEGQAEDG